MQKKKSFAIVSVVLKKGNPQQTKYMHSDKHLKTPENTKLAPTIYLWMLKRHTTL